MVKRVPLALLMLFFREFQAFAGVAITGNAEIVVGEHPNYVAQFAAAELSRFLGKALGKVIPVKQSSDAAVRIHVGIGPDGKPMAENDDSRIIVRKDGAVYIYGFDSPGSEKKSIMAMVLDVAFKGTLEAVYTFLEDSVGVRWLEPGAKGEYAPKVERIELQEGEKVLTPSFKERRTYYLRRIATSWYSGRCKDEPEYGTEEEFLLWGLRLRYTPFKARVMGCHTPSYIYMDKHLFPKRPELFALQADGSRSDKDLCWTCQETKDFWWSIVDAYFRGDPNPKAVGIDEEKWNPNLFILKDEFMIDPHDYGKEFFCKCPTCTAIVQKYGEENGTGEVVFQTIAEVARKVERKYPGKYITTLVYPPKKMYPESVELPKNVRVRMTVDSLAISDDESVIDKELELMRKWSTEQESKIGLWMYLVANHGLRYYGIPEFASGNFISFLRRAWPYADCIFYEHTEPFHTICNLDMYLISHALWNKEMDVDAVKDEYMKLYFGAAADDMKSFCNRLERNWTEVMRTSIAHPDERPLPIAYKLRKRIFNTIYTYDELESLQKLLDSAKAKLPRDSVEVERVRRYEKYVLGNAKKEFSVYTDDKAHSYFQQDTLCCLKVKDAPTEADWEKAPQLPMVTAHEGKKITAGAKVRVLSSDSAFHVRAVFDDPLIAQSRTKYDAANIHNIWTDNEMELFFAAQKTGEIIHLGINDMGKTVLHLPKGNKFSFPGKEVKVSVKKFDTGWQVDASIDNSLTGFDSASDEDCFNITRTRNVAKLLTEYSTYNPDCIVNHWTSPMYYSIVRRVSLREPEKEYQGAALPVSKDKAVVIDDDAVAAGSGWVRWAPPTSHTEFYRDDKVKHGKGASYCIDSMKDDYSVKDKSCSWRISRELPPKGTRIRTTAWVRVKSTVPDAAVKLTLNWLDESKRWYTKQELGGSRVLPARNGEWQKIDMEIVVPDVADIKYFSPTISGVHTYPGKLWIGELKLETIAP
ncbi:MAG: DUF4838 domain-containing protein [Victivallales bacterium]|nr:DUF4838 domain-containing protein [Victivallales bacterium]